MPTTDIEIPILTIFLVCPKRFYVTILPFHYAPCTNNRRIIPTNMKMISVKLLPALCHYIKNRLR